MTATLRRLQKKKVKMPDSSELLKNIIHYQKSLDRYSQSRDDAKILHCIFKLFNMPVTVTHLEETGIGRTVNSLRKLGGEVEDAAKTLVRKWKDMVSEKDDENEPESRSNGITSREGNENNSSHKHSDRKEKPNKDDKYKTTKKDKYDNHRHQSTSESKHKSSSSKYSKEEEDRNSYESDNDEDNESGVASESEESSMEEEETEEIIVKVSKHEKESGKHSDKEIRHKESSSERSSKHKKDSEGTRKERSQSKEKIRKHESQSEHDHRKRQKRDSSSSDTEQIIKTNKSSSSKRKYEDSASDEEIKKKISKKSSPSSSHRSNSSHRSKESSYEHKKESKSEILDDSSFHKSSHKSKESGSSRDRKEISKSDSNKKESRSSSKSDSKYEKRKLESDKEDNTKSESAKSRKEKSGSLGSDKKHSGEKEKSKSKHSSKSSSNSSNTIGSSASAQFVDIGSESGTSFAEALGMLEPTTSKISSKKSKPSLEMVTHHKIEKPERERIKEKPVIEKPSKCDKIDIVIPPPPPKSDLDINIASLLPPITPNYRPVSNPFFDGGCSRNKVMNDDEALSLVMSQKNMRTKVFSGNKCFFGTVPTLFELCIRVLQDNIDALEYTGGVPYAILKPILDKATPDQLFMLEHHNPYLIEDTDEIWKFHCQKEFRNKKREELESWRDMYMRCLDEREAKLKALTENIKLAQDKSTPVRQTKLAYVDSHSVVKPPRDVIRKQAKSGFIDKKPVVTPSSRLSSLATGGATGQVAVPSPPKASSSSGSSATVKPKKAPLMQKTLQFLKGNRFRR